MALVVLMDELTVNRLAAPAPPSDQLAQAPTVRHLPGDSTQLWEQHREAMPAALIRHDALVWTAIESHGGVVFKTVGDALCAAFARAPDALAAAKAYGCSTG